MNEWYLVLNRFFDGLDPDLFRAAFGTQFRNPDT